jgi:hypothetical protein
MDNGRSRLTDEQAAWIRDQVAAGASQRVLARSLNLGETLISNLVNRKTYRHV